MTRRSLVTAVVAAMVMVGSIFVGCSEDNIIITNAASGERQTLSEIQRMFPAQVGYQSIFEVTQSNGSSEIVTYTVGEEVIFGYSTAHEMHVRSSSGERYTNYFVFSDSALFFYENWSDEPEKVLSIPLSSGATWNKSDDVTTLTTGDTTSTDNGSDDNQTNDYKGGGDDPVDPKPGDSDGGGAAKNFPGNNAGNFTIEGIETLALSNGDIFSGTVRVRADGNAVTNYYWFAPGIGLVRWVLEADQNDMFDGTEVGELILYGVQSF